MPKITWNPPIGFGFLSFVARFELRPLIIPAQKCVSIPPAIDAMRAKSTSMFTAMQKRLVCLPVKPAEAGSRDVFSIREWSFDQIEGQNAMLPFLGWEFDPTLQTLSPQTKESFLEGFQDLTLIATQRVPTHIHTQFST